MTRVAARTRFPLAGPRACFLMLSCISADTAQGCSVVCMCSDGVVFWNADVVSVLLMVMVMVMVTAAPKIMVRQTQPRNR